MIVTSWAAGRWIELTERVRPEMHSPLRRIYRGSEYCRAETQMVFNSMANSITI